jgi:hypothetical protein
MWGPKADAGIRSFFTEARASDSAVYLSVITLGEMRPGVERIRHRGDRAQATRLEQWLKTVSENYADAILPKANEIERLVERDRALWERRGTSGGTQSCAPHQGSWPIVECDANVRFDGSRISDEVV